MVCVYKYVDVFVCRNLILHVLFGHIVLYLKLNISQDFLDFWQNEHFTSGCLDIHDQSLPADQLSEEYNHLALLVSSD